MDTVDITSLAIANDITIGHPNTPFAVPGHEVYYIDGTYAARVGVLIGNTLHSMCTRCSTGYGVYLDNGLHDQCYKCKGRGTGAPTTPRALARRGAKRVASMRETCDIMDARRATLEAWKADNADMVAFINKKAIRSDFFDDLNRRIDDYARTSRGPRDVLSAGQMAAVRRIMDRENTPIAAKAPEGRATIAGTIKSIKHVTTSFGYSARTTTRCVIESPDGWRVAGTLPAPVCRIVDRDYDYDYDTILGREITFTATVTPSTDDAAFGFYSRPTGAKLTTV